MRHDLTNRITAQARAKTLDVHATARIFNTLAAIGGLLVVWAVLVAL